MSGKTGNKDLQLNLGKQLIISVTLSILFGLGWGIGLAATQSLRVNFLRFSFQIIFILLTAFQGLLLLVAYGIRLKKVRMTWLKWVYIVLGQHDKASSIDITGTLRLSSFKGRQGSGMHQQFTLGKFDDMGTDNVELKHFSSFKAPSPTSFSSSEIGTSCSHEKEEREEKKREEKWNEESEEEKEREEKREERWKEEKSEEREDQLNNSNVLATHEESPSFLHRGNSQVHEDTAESDQAKFKSLSSEDIPSSIEQRHLSQSPTGINVSITDTTTSKTYCTERTSDNHTELNTELMENGVANGRVSSSTSTQV